MLINGTRKLLKMVAAVPPSFTPVDLVGVITMCQKACLWYQHIDNDVFTDSNNQGVLPGLWAQISFKDSYDGASGFTTRDDQESLLNVVSLKWMLESMTPLDTRLVIPTLVTVIIIGLISNPPMLTITAVQSSTVPQP